TGRGAAGESLARDCRATRASGHRVLARPGHPRGARHLAPRALPTPHHLTPSSGGVFTVPRRNTPHLEDTMSATLTPFGKRIALTHVKRERRARAIALEEYAADLAADAAVGYRGHYCIHGTDQWTDHDNICGPC